MPPPSPLVIATGAVNRLLKEEASYHKELEEQEAQLKAQEEKVKSGQEDEDGNATYILKQQVSWTAYAMLRFFLTKGGLTKGLWL